MAAYYSPWIDPRVDRVTPEQLKRYLAAHGWICKEGRSNLYYPPTLREDIINPAVRVSTVTDDAGYASGVVLAITDIAKFEGRYAVDVLNEILGDSANGTPANGVVTAGASA